MWAVYRGERKTVLLPLFFPLMPCEIVSWTCLFLFCHLGSVLIIFYQWFLSLLKTWKSDNKCSVEGRKKKSKLNVFLHLLSILLSSASNTQRSTTGGKLLTCSASPDVFSVYGYRQPLDLGKLSSVPGDSPLWKWRGRRIWRTLADSPFEECRLEGGGRCSRTYIFLLWQTRKIVFSSTALDTYFNAAGDFLPLTFLFKQCLWFLMTCTNFQKGKPKMPSQTDDGFRAFVVCLCFVCFFFHFIRLKTKQNQEENPIFLKISVSHSGLLTGFFHHLLKRLLSVTAGKGMLW